MATRNKIFAPLGLALILTLGIGAVWGVLVGWGVGLVNQMVCRGQLTRQTTVRIDGTPVIRTYGSNLFRDWTETTLDGEPLDDFLSAGTLGDLDGAHLPGTTQSRWFFGRSWHDRIRVFSVGRRPATFWYLIHSGRRDGLAYFVGYSSQSKLPIGYIGRQGFRADRPPATDHFPIDGRMIAMRSTMVSQSSGYGLQEPYYTSSGETFPGQVPHSAVYLISRDRLLEIDLEKRSTRVLHEGAGLFSQDILGQAAEHSFSSKEELLAAPPLPQHLVARSADRLLFFNGKGDVDRIVTIPTKLRGREFVLYDLGSGRQLARVRRDIDGTTRYAYYWFDSDGTVTDRKEVALYYRSFPQGTAAVSGVLSAAVAAPAVVTPGVAVVMPLMYVVEGRAADYRSALAMVLSEAWPALLVVWGLTAALVLLCYRRQRRHASEQTWVWVIWVLLFGVPGYLGYLFHRRWPARQPCPTCGEDAPRDRPACMGCGNDFPLPAEKGIEVFA